MVDITGVRDQFIYAVVFIAIFAALITAGVASAPQLFTGTTEKNYYSTPEYFEASELEDLATFYTINCSVGGGYYQHAWGISQGFGHNFLFKSNVVSGEVKIQNQHYYYFLIFPHGHHDMNWKAKKTGEDYGGALVQSEFDEVAETDPDTNQTSAGFAVRCDHINMHAVMGFNYTLWDNATHAFQNDDLHVTFAIEWDEMGTGLNAWSLISQLMTFQKPDVHPTVNTFIAIPLWALIGFIVVVVILAIIDALPFT